MKLLRKKPKVDPALATGAGSANGNSYIDAQNVWYERYGTYVAQAYNWRLIAVLEAIALIIAICGGLYLAAQTKYVPYVVAIDKVGMAFAVHPADRASPVDERVVRAELAQWLIAARSVVTDRILELETLNEHVYPMVESDSAAKQFLDDYYSKGHNPLAIGEKQNVTININSILPLSAQSYEMQWTEVARDHRGKTVSTQTWDATISIAFRAPNDEATILMNPLGLYVTDINWQQKL